MYKKTRSEGFGPEVKRRIMLGSFVLSSGYYDAYYLKALRVKALIKKAFDEAFAKYDVILGPVAPTTAPKIGSSLADPIKMYLGDIYTISVNLAGLPGISVPCGKEMCIRDRLQVVIREPELLKGIKKEECISIDGIMEQRDEETYNPKIPSGTIELEAKKITVLGQVYQQVPFEIQTSKEVREDVRLKYRYLDLRNPKVKDNMVFRSKVISFLRQKMTDIDVYKRQLHR